MKAIGRQDRIDNGFIKAVGYGDEREIKDYAIRNRYALMGMVDIQEVLYGEKPKEVLIIGRWRDIADNVMEYQYYRYLIMIRGIECVVIEDTEEYSEIRDVFYRKTMDTLRFRTKYAIKKKVEEGNFAGRKVPYGYFRMGDKLYIDEYESFVVKFVFYRHLQGGSCRLIAEELNLRDFTTRKKLAFNANKIQSIINNRRFYQGYVEYKGKEYKGKWKPILTEDTLLTEAFIRNVFIEGDRVSEDQ